MTNSADEQLLAALEAILIVASEPLSPEELASRLQSGPQQVKVALEQLRAEYAGETARPHGFVLRNVAGGWRIYSAPEQEEIVANFLTQGGTSHLSNPALETLAVIAYRQPVSRSVIAGIRGVSVDGVVRTLLAHDLIEEVERTESGAILYGTTTSFLERMGLASLEELPPLAPHLPANEELDELEARLKH